MRTCRGLLLVFLAGPYLACLADEGASIPPAAATTAAAADAAEDEVFSKLAEAEQAANAAAAAAQRAAASLEDMENRAHEEEGQEENEGSEERVDSNDDHVDGGAAAAEDDEAALEAAPAAAAPAADAVAEAAADTAAAAAEGVGDEDDDLVDSAAAAAERALGDEDGGGGGGFDAEKWKRAAGRQWGRVTGRVDGFIDGWRRDGDGNPFKGALGSYDALLEEHYLKMSFGQATALGAVGDTVAQRLERWRNPGQRYEVLRTVHAGILNMIIDGIFTPHWYNLVDYINDEMTLGLAFVKAVASSVFYSPFANGLFLAGARVLRYGFKTRFGWAEWRRQLTVCTIRDFEYWIPLETFTQRVLRRRWRPLATNIFEAGFLVILSTIANDDVRRDDDAWK